MIKSLNRCVATALCAAMLLSSSGYGAAAAGFVGAKGVAMTPKTAVKGLAAPGAFLYRGVGVDAKVRPLTLPPVISGAAAAPSAPVTISPIGAAKARPAVAARIAGVAQVAAADLGVIRERASAGEAVAGSSQRVIDLLQGREGSSEASLVSTPLPGADVSAPSGLSPAASRVRAANDPSVRPAIFASAPARPRWTARKIAAIAVPLVALAIYALVAAPAAGLTAIALVGSLGIAGWFRFPSGSETRKINTARRWAADQSPTARALDQEFSGKRGTFQIDDNRDARYFGAAIGSSWNPSIALTWDMLWRVIQHENKGAPWEFIASVIAREQVLSSDWYNDIPDSADKLSAVYMNMVRVFVELTDGTSRSWATDKDFKAVQHDETSYVMWSWFAQLLGAARDAVFQSVHLNQTEFFRWVADFSAQQGGTNAAFQVSLWEQHKGVYFRPGDPRDGQPIPAGIRRIDRATYDRASRKIYGEDGSGIEGGGISGNNVFGWMIQWLRGRGEI